MGSEPEHARQALAYIRGLFDLERHLAEAPRRKREAVRAEHAKPLVEGFFQWCAGKQDQVLDDTPIAKAVRYAMNQREALSRFLDDGRLPLHNNGSELQLRRQAIGVSLCLTSSSARNRKGAIISSRSTRATDRPAIRDRALHRRCL